MNINQYIDHTQLKATAKEADIIKLCEEAKTYQFYAVCVNGCYVKLAKKHLRRSGIEIAAVIGFPLGAMSSKTKIYEAKQCIRDGATEIDMVINIGKLKEGDYQYVEDEIRQIKTAIGIDNTLKVIFENCYLTKEEIIIASRLAVNAGADYIKTSTGFGTGGATFQDVVLMKHVVKDEVFIKASGGIRDLETAKEYIKLGARRLGTSSGVSFVTSGVAETQEY